MDSGSDFIINIYIYITSIILLYIYIYATDDKIVLLKCNYWNLYLTLNCLFISIYLNA